MATKVIVPPIKSQGIKTKLVPWIRDLVPSRSGRWIEPFLGTGVVGFNMGFERAIMSDSNPHIIRFYSDVQAGRITPGIVKGFPEKEAEFLCKADDKGYAHFRVVRDRFNASFEPLDLLFPLLWGEGQGEGPTRAGSRAFPRRRLRRSTDEDSPSPRGRGPG